jgi:hypothetical protein
MAAFTDPVFVVVTIAIAILANLLPSRLERWWGHWSTRRAERTRIGEDRPRQEGRVVCCPPR